MSLGTILLIVLVIALLGGFSGIGGGPFYGTGYYGGGGYDDGCYLRRYRVFDGWGWYWRSRVVCY